jgi:hypothetical protein
MIYIDGHPLDKAPGSLATGVTFLTSNHTAFLRGTA